MHPRIAEVVDHLKRERQGLHAAVAEIPTEHLGVEPAPGSWSVLAVLEHLALVEARVAAALAARIAEGRAAGVGDETDSTPVLPTMDLQRVLDRSATITAPAAVQPREIRDLDTIWEALAESRARLHSVVTSADGFALKEVNFPHAVFGPLDGYTWIALVGSHEARHAAQIREIGTSVAGR